MTNRLQAIIPAMFQPTDPAVPAAVPDGSGRAGRLTASAAIGMAVLVVGLIAVLMGMT